MRKFPRRNLIAYVVGTMLATPAMVSTAAFADSAAGVNSTLGNARNPAPINPIAEQAGGTDPDGMGLHGSVSRTPSGQMFDYPNADPPMPKGAPIATTRATIEVGGFGVGGDRNAAMFRMYQDFSRSGATLGAFSFISETPETARYVEAGGSNLGRRDQFGAVTIGRYNDWKIRLFFDEIPHTFTTTAKPVWDGVGTGHLTLPANLPPAGGIVCATSACNAFSAPAYGISNASIFNAPSFAANGLGFAVANRLQSIVAAKDPSELGLTRKKGGLALNVKLNETTSVYASYSQERREGSRPFGSVQNGGDGSLPMETVEPIDYTTHDLRAGLHYAATLTQVNVNASASYFRNDVKSLVFDVPFVSAIGATAPLITQGRFALAPNNDAYNVRSEIAHSMPGFYRSRLTATVAVGSSRQNDALLPPTITSGVGAARTGAGAFNGNFNQWNTTAALSRQNADARIDTTLLDVKFALKPISSLNVEAKARHYETDNRTDYMACNPNATYGNGLQYSAFGCTGVWGRLINDSTPVFLNAGNASSGLIPVTLNPFAGNLSPAPSANVEIRNAPSDYKQDTFSLTTDYRIDKFSTITAILEREEYRRRNRERDRTSEDKLKVTYTHRAIGDANLRVSAEADRRRGSDYNAAVNYNATTLAFFDPAQIAALGIGANRAQLSGFVDRVSTLRRYDLADRDLSVINARLNIPLQADLDLAMSLQSRDAKYPNSAYGRTDKQTQQSANVDLNYQPSPARVMYASAGYQTGTLNQANVSMGEGVDAAGRTRTYPAGCVVGYVAASGVTITPQNAEQVCGDPANNLSFNLNNAWTSRSRDTHQTLNIGVKQSLGKSTLDINLGRYLGRTRISYVYNPTNPSVDGLPASPFSPVSSAPAATLAAVGNGFPDLVTNTTSISAQWLMPISAMMSVRVSAYHEIGRIRDWHYQGLEQNLLLTTGSSYVINLLDAGPRDYRTSAIGVMLQFRL